MVMLELGVSGGVRGCWRKRRTYGHLFIFYKGDHSLAFMPKKQLSECLRLLFLH